MKCINCGCDAEVLDKGRMINRAALLGSQIISLQERIVALEKQARKTPAKTLLSERQKVQAAKELLLKAQTELVIMVAEWKSLKEKLGWS